MRRLSLEWVVLAAAVLVGALGAAPAAPNYHAVEQSIERARGQWTRPGAAPQVNAPGWNALFDSTIANLQAYTSATTENDRLTALGHLYQISVGLASVPWAPAGEIRESLREWLRPRVRLAWAERRLVEGVRALPAVSNPAVMENRERWMKFVGTDLGTAINQYDAAPTVAKRASALKSVHAALDALQSRHQATPWAYSGELLAALNDLYNLPNLDISIDVQTLSPAINVNLVTSGPVTRKGYVSQVTAGPKTGFGLMWSDNGIAFFNSQLLTSVTPIWDFQQQVENNPQGRRAARMYQFNATTIDHSELTITTIFRSNGMQIIPSYKHNANANITTNKQNRGGLARAIASLVGYNQSRITQMAWENAIGQIRSNIEKEAMEEGLERTGQEAASRNAQLAQYLLGNDRVMFQNVLIDGLTLRSRPENALIGGKVHHLRAGDQGGADAPQPPTLWKPDSGVSADVHLSSIMTSFTRGFLATDAVKTVENLMIVTHKIPPGTPPSEGIKAVRNADYATFLHSVETAQAANDPKVLAIRVKRPGTAPDFGADSHGNLVAIVHDFQIDVPAPPQAARGGGAMPAARALRISAPAAEISLSFKVEPKTAEKPLRLSGRIEAFDPGPGAKVYALGDDEKRTTQLSAFTTVFVFGIIRSKLQGQPVDIPLSNLQVRGFEIISASALDPSGWIRVNLARTSSNPGSGLQAPPGAIPLNPAMTPNPAVGPRTTASPSPLSSLSR
jgi:hypothetical protein